MKRAAAVLVTPFAALTKTEVPVMAKPIIYSFDQSEKWLPVVGYEGLYDVSERGGVRSYRRTGKSGTFSTALPMTLAISNVGYPRVSLRIRRTSITQSAPV